MICKPLGCKQSISLSKRWIFVTSGPKGGGSSKEIFFFFFFFSMRNIAKDRTWKMLESYFSSSSSPFSLRELVQVADLVVLEVKLNASMCIGDVFHRTNLLELSVHFLLGVCLVYRWETVHNQVIEVWLIRKHLHSQVGFHRDRFHWEKTADSIEKSSWRTYAIAVCTRSRPRGAPHAGPRSQ